MTLRIALAQFDFTVGAIARNAERIAAMIVEARDVHRADVVLFPELALSGYPPEDLLVRPAFLADCETALQDIAAGVQGIVAMVGWPQSAGSVVYNAVSVLRDGGIEVTYRKRELPNYAVFDERRYFDVDPDGGSCVVDINGVGVGVLICEDLWFPEPLAKTVAAGARLVLVPNASPFERAAVLTISSVHTSSLTQSAPSRTGAASCEPRSNQVSSHPPSCCGSNALARPRTRPRSGVHRKVSFERRVPSANARVPTMRFAAMRRR